MSQNRQNVAAPKPAAPKEEIDMRTLLDMPTGLSEEAAVIIQKQKNLKLQFNINELKELRAENEDLKKTLAINKNILSQVLNGD